MPRTLLAQPQTQVPPTSHLIPQAFPPALNPYQLSLPLPHEHNVARPSPVAGLSQVYSKTWHRPGPPLEIPTRYQPPVTDTTAPWMRVERELKAELKADLEGESEPELAHFLNSLDGVGAAPAMPATKCGSQKGYSRASTRASSRISMTSTQLRDTIDEALEAQAQELTKQTLEMKREMAAQAKQMEQLVRGAVREAANKATKDTAKSFKEQQEREWGGQAPPPGIH